MNLPDNLLDTSETFKTVGELKAFLGMFPEDMPLFTDRAERCSSLLGVQIYFDTMKKEDYNEDNYLPDLNNNGFVGMCVACSY